MARCVANIRIKFNKRRALITVRMFTCERKDFFINIILQLHILAFKGNLDTLSGTGTAMLFSAGTFLYVATVHVLPEVKNV